jgi:hypothetical protein
MGTPWPSVKYLFVSYHFLDHCSAPRWCVADLEDSLEDTYHAVAAQTQGPTAKRRIACIG